jgi:hypothetical protein
VPGKSQFSQEPTSLLRRHLLHSIERYLVMQDSNSLLSKNRNAVRHTFHPGLEAAPITMMGGKGAVQRDFCCELQLRLPRSLRRAQIGIQSFPSKNGSARSKKS